VKLYRCSTEEKKEFVLSNQVVRSDTSSDAQAIPFRLIAKNSWKSLVWFKKTIQNQSD